MSRRIKLGIFVFLLLAVLVTCGVMIGGELLSRQKEKEDFEQLAKLVTVEKPSAAPDPSNSPIASMPPDNTDVPKKPPAENEPAQRDLSELFAMNDYFVVWLCIPDTDINYPVMHTPDDPERYLRRNFHGEYSESGVPFLDFRCTLDSDNLIIYGHHMNDGSMFSTLLNYADEDYCAAHPEITLETEQGVESYLVAAIVRAAGSYGPEDWSLFDQINMSVDSFNVLVENLNERRLYDTGRELVFGDRLLTLVTCEYSQNNGRLAVIAVKE